MLKVVVSHSEQVSVDDVLAEIFEQCQEQLGGQRPQAGILFAAVDFDYQAILSGVQERWPGLQLIGCTTDGEVSSRLGFVDDSVSLTLFASDSLDITTGVARSVSKGVTAAAQEAVGTARASTTKEPGLCIITPASMTVSNETIVAAFVESLGSETPLFGASAGDQWRFKNTFQFYNDEVLEDAVPLLMFSGPIKVSSGVDSGWKTIGPVGKVTRSEGNVVHEIDGKPALDFYRSLLGDGAVPSGDRPLAIVDSDGKINRLRASNESFDAETGAVTFFGDFTQGDLVQITLAARDEILAGTRVSAERARATYPAGSPPDAVLCLSCASRKLLLGTRTREEFDILTEVVGTDVPVFGFYGYGEIGPSMTGRSICEFHNQTIVTVLFGA